MTPDCPPIPHTLVNLVTLRHKSKRSELKIQRKGGISVFCIRYAMGVLCESHCLGHCPGRDPSPPTYRTALRSDHVMLCGLLADNRDQYFSVRLIFLCSNSTSVFVEAPNSTVDCVNPKCSSFTHLVSMDTAFVFAVTVGCDTC